MKIYLVKGESGKYDDFDDWNVKASQDKEKAKQFRKDCLKEGKRLAKECVKLNIYFCDLETQSKYDSKLHGDIEEFINYIIEEIELE